MSLIEDDNLEDRLRWARIDSKVKELRLRQLFAVLNDNDIDGVVLKGWSVARFYPSSLPRTYTDIDIAVNPTNYDRTKQLLRGRAAGSQVDLHKGLRELDNLGWDEIISRSYEVDLDGTPIKVLSDEDNLRITAVHWLTDGGVYREKLWDIYYLIQNRREDFNWERSIDSNGEVRKTWVLAAIAAAVEFLNLEPYSLPIEVRNSRLPDWFRNTLKKEWELGPYPRIPLKFCLKSPRVLLEQFRRRVPPNKIAATIEMEEPIDERRRTLTQIRSARKRARSLMSQLKVFGIDR